MKTILIVVDMQRDFVDGVFRNQDAIDMTPALIEFLKSHSYDHIFLTRDTHYETDYKDTVEVELPKHCIFGTKGWEFIEGLVEAASEKTAANHVYIWQKSMFGDYLLPQILNEWSLKGRAFRIEIIGVCTDICVISNALILRSFLPEAEIIVHSNLCAGTTPKNHEAALKVMKSCLIDVR